MTLQRVVSAHAAARGLVICRLESMQGHANSTRAGSSCIARLSLAQPEGQRRPQKTARPGHTGLGQVIGVPVMQ